MIQKLITLAIISIYLSACFLTVLSGCSTPELHRKKPYKVTMTVTAYCPCGKCCGWKRNWYGRPVYAYGPNKGKRKKVGICADGTKARKGTVAADTRYYPFNTRLHIPGYGYGVVHDRGGAIKGRRHIDIFFPKHETALEWGRQTLEVTVYPQ